MTLEKWEQEIIREALRRANGNTSKRIMLQGRVDEDAWMKASKAADAAGVSLAFYLQRLVERDEVDVEGCPVWLDPHEKEDLKKTA